MKLRSVRRPAVTLLVAFSLCLADAQTRAQTPDTLQHSIAAPPVGAQSGAQLGYSVATDGAYTVVGAPFDDLQGIDAGAVKVFDSSTGALLHVIQNPSPAQSDDFQGDHFGHSVAISGTRVVVGAYRDDPGEDNAGSAYVYDLSSGTPTVPVATLNKPGAAGDDRFGYSVAISGTRVVVGAIGDNTGAFDAGSAYVYDLSSGTPTVPVATLNNPGPAAFDEFGYAVAISGTGVVVGVRLDDTAATDAGIAYLYDLSSVTPTVPVATLNNPGPALNDQFGSSVAISGMGVVVGARFDDTGAGDAGSAYVYDLSSGMPMVPVATLNNPDPAVNDQFGFSVAIWGMRVVVGAPFDNTGASDAGSAYVYDLSSGTPTVPVATLNNPSPALRDNFGHSMAISGTQVVVGAIGDRTGAIEAGSAYVYDLSSATPTVPLARLHNPGPAAGDNFGTSVAISGTRLVVGAYAADAGRAYVYDLGSATPTIPVATLNNPSPAASDSFGASVAISGTRVVVGAAGDDTGASAAGKAYVYDLSSATPTVPVATLNSPSPAASDSFGAPVAISGTRVVVGAYLDDTNASDAGSAYVYDVGSETPTVPVATLNNPDPALGDLFGVSVAISGTRVVVGAYLNDTGVTDAGSAYVYDLSSGTPTVPVATLNNPSPAAFEYFSNSVAICGTRVVVGAHGDDAGASGAGTAYVYDLNSGTPMVPVVTLNNPGPATDDSFGISLAISGATVVVGAYADDTGASNAGSAYVYDLSSGTPTMPVATLNNPGPATSDLFGASVAIDGMRAAIGAPWDDSPQADKGSTYAYAPAVTVQSAASRKVHGSAGAFDVPLALTGTPAIEPRSGGATGDYTLVLTFLGEVSVSGNPQAAVTSGSGTIGSGGTSNGGVVMTSGNVVTIPLTNVANAQTIHVTLNNVDGATTVTIPMGVLIGDVNGNGAVTASDIGQVKAASGQPVSSANFRADVNANGSINATDIGQVKAQSGTTLP